MEQQKEHKVKTDYRHMLILYDAEVNPECGDFWDVSSDYLKKPVFDCDREYE